MKVPTILIIFTHVHIIYMHSITQSYNDDETNKLWNVSWNY